MASLFGRGFNPLHLHYVTMKGLEPFIVYFWPLHLHYVTKQKRLNLNGGVFFFGGAYPIRTGVHGFADR